MSRPLRSLYICYFPLNEPLVQTQVIAYLSGLAQQGHIIHLLTFETAPLSFSEQRQWRRRLKGQGIVWHSLRYHKRPSLPATAYDVLCGVAAGLKLIRRYHLDAVHARSHVPATMGLILKQLTGCRLIFDIRGLLAEEYEDAGTWQRDSLPFRLTKAVERRCLHSADGIVVLTERLREFFFGEQPDPRVRVIPCCADLTQIQQQSSQREAMRQQLNLQDKTVMVYVGKFGSWYMQSEMVDFFVAARKVIGNLHFLVLTQSDQQLIRNECSQRGIPISEYTVTKAAPSQVGAYLAAADFAISFIKACPSKIASSPTKLGEYMAAGLPVVCNPGIGDVDAIVTDNNVGVLTEDFTPQAYSIAAHQIQTLMRDAHVGERCHETAQATASLQEIGIPRYESLYEEVARDFDTLERAIPALPCPPVEPPPSTHSLSSLYLCYFPLSEPLVQTQVIAYLSGLAKNGHNIHLLTFEPTPLSPEARRQAWLRLKAQGIVWHSLRYHKRPSLPATAYDVLCGVAAGLKLIRRY
ncbi:MAG: glycosyltransferase family 4 protein, partial [Abitibacteriaceae bacterium]|nr:glycosyltransferase family 4 protein [Abditibacteriaceae bacterium]